MRYRTRGDRFVDFPIYWWISGWSGRKCPWDVESLKEMEQSETKNPPLIDFFASMMTARPWKKALRALGVLLGVFYLVVDFWLIFGLAWKGVENQWFSLLSMLGFLIYGLLLLIPFGKLVSKPHWRWLFLGISAGCCIRIVSSLIQFRHDDLPMGGVLITFAILAVSIGNAFLAIEKLRELKDGGGIA